MHASFGKALSCAAPQVGARVTLAEARVPRAARRPYSAVLGMSARRFGRLVRQLEKTCDPSHPISSTKKTCRITPAVIGRQDLRTRINVELMSKSWPSSLALMCNPLPQHVVSNGWDKGNQVTRHTGSQALDFDDHRWCRHGAPRQTSLRYSRVPSAPEFVIYVLPQTATTTRYTLANRGHSLGLGRKSVPPAWSDDADLDVLLPGLPGPEIV